LTAQKHKYHKENKEGLLDATKEVRLKVNKEKYKYILISYYQNTGQNHNIKILNKSCENVINFKYLGITVTNKSNNNGEIGAD
jgi:hypothetical protein